MSVFVLAHALDPTAKAILDEAKGRGWQPQLVTFGELRRSGWSQCISEVGASQSVVSCVQPLGAWCVVNRLGNLAVPGTAGWNGRDDEYGRAEFLALLISWLRGLGPRVIDPPGGNSLLGQSVGQWSERRLAQDCGLQPHPVFAVSRVKRAPWRGDSPSGLSGMRPVDDLACPLIVGSEVFGTPPEVRNACLRLAGKLGVDTLRIALAPGEEGWRFVECDRLPELTEGPALRALADLAEARSA